MSTTRDINAYRKEADVYYSMGLFKEALAIYSALRKHLGEQASKDSGITSIIDDINKKLQAGHMEEKVSSADFRIINQAISSGDGKTSYRDSAIAFIELGLINEAILEYEKLKKESAVFPVEAIYGLFACFSAKGLPTEVKDNILNFISGREGDASHHASLLFALGNSFEKKSHTDAAIELYKEANQLDPNNGEISSHLNKIIASFSSGSRYDYLLNSGLVSSNQLQKALISAKQSKKSVEAILLEQFNIPKAEIGKSLSLFYGCPFREFQKIDIPIELISNLKKAFLLHDMWVPLSWSKNGVEILVDDPKDLRKTDQIRGLIKTRNVKLYVGIREDIEQFINYFFSAGDSSPEDAATGQFSEEFDALAEMSFEEEIDEMEDVQDESSSQVVRFVDQVLVTAHRRNVSDIHIEPSDITKTTGIRFRQDGVCNEYAQVPNSLAKGILSRIKIMANLDIAERRLPQDGKISFKRKGVQPFELRVATIPTAGGYEDAVMRILAKAGAMPVSAMGLSPRNMEILLKILALPYGIILVVGPTGSGKTTTLHAALGHINKPSVKIWTAEDPVEISQPGLRQVEVKPKIGLDFARVMRAFLRADPDVIMIGEMRDYETASIGIEASLTGHLVLSTLHTNSAPETITRLLDMGLNPLNFSDAFLGVLAQRLVRRLCKNCKEAYSPAKEELESMIAEYGEEAFAQDNIVDLSSEITLYRIKGCDECSGSGYKGRLGIHELMEGTDEMKRFIKRQANAEEMFKQAFSEGMRTLKQDGILKVFQGSTDMQEVRRVCIA